MSTLTSTRKPTSIYFLFILLFASHAWAENYGTPEQFINGILFMSESKCGKRGELVKEYERQGKAAEAYSTKNAEIMICDCMPNRAKKLKEILSKLERSTKISESTFTSKYLPQIIDQCSAEQARAIYADGCAARFSKAKRNSDMYCSCMSDYLAKISDGEATQIGLESATYIPLAADAKNKGLPPPQQLPAFKRFMSVESTCSAQ